MSEINLTNRIFGDIERLNRSMRQPPCSHCIDCNVERADELMFKGRRCRTCWNLYQNLYYKNNLGAVRAKQKEIYDRLRVISLATTPKIPKAIEKDSEEIKTQLQKKRERSLKHYHRKKLRAFARECAEESRKYFKRNLNRNIDREFYVDNDTWVIPHTYYMEFSSLKDQPMKEFDYDYWFNKNYWEDVALLDSEGL